MRNPYLYASFRVASFTTTLRVFAGLVLLGGGIAVVYSIVGSHVNAGPARTAAALSLGIPVLIASALLFIASYGIDLMAEMIDAIKRADEDDTAEER